MADDTTAVMFDLPLRIDPTTGDFAVVEQDSVDDYANCVQIVCLTRPGQRLEDPEFGLTEMALAEEPIDGAVLLAQIAASEPRAGLLARIAPDVYDAAVYNVSVVVGDG